TQTPLAATGVLLLLFVFLSVNIPVLVLNRDKVEAGHFQDHWVIPVLAILSCLILLTQQVPETWISAAMMISVGAALYAL
ncbi:amino acid permease, partial [Pseudomonas syringae pv. tagetis]